MTKRFADEFLKLCERQNGFNLKGGEGITDDHRYLVNEKAKLMFYRGCWRRTGTKGRYDQRNEWAYVWQRGKGHRPFGREPHHLPEEYYENP